MARADLKNVLKIFQGGEPSPEEKQELFKEVLLMTLARATSADTNTKAVEVETVQRVLGQVLGENLEDSSIDPIYSEKRRGHPRSCRIEISPEHKRATSARLLLLLFAQISLL